VIADNLGADLDRGKKKPRMYHAHGRSLGKKRPFPEERPIMESQSEKVTQPETHRGAIQHWIAHLLTSTTPPFRYSVACFDLFSTVRMLPQVFMEVKCVGV